MNLIPDILSFLALVISIATFLFSIRKFKDYEKKITASKRTELLEKISSIILLLDNILLELEGWLEAEIELWPRNKEELEKRAIHEQNMISKLKNKLQQLYDNASNYSGTENVIELESLLAFYNKFSTEFISIKNRTIKSKGRLESFSEQIVNNKSE